MGKTVKILLPLQGSSAAYRIHHHEPCKCGFPCTVAVSWESEFTMEELATNFNMELPKEISYLKLKLK